MKALDNGKIYCIDRELRLMDIGAGAEGGQCWC